MNYYLSLIVSRALIILVVITMNVYVVMGHVGREQDVKTGMGLNMSQFLNHLALVSNAEGFRTVSRYLWS